MKIAFSALMKNKILGVFLLLLALGLFGAASDDLITLINLFSTKSSLIYVDHYMSFIFILAAAILPIALLFMFGKQTSQVLPRKRQTRLQKLKSDRQFMWAQLYVLYLFVSILGALFAPIPQFFIVNHLATERGYIYCPASLFSRREPDRWALPGPHGETEHCPHKGALAAKT